MTRRKPASPGVIFALAIMAIGCFSCFADTSLSEKINAAKEGETILISGPEAFSAPIIIRKPLTLVGTNGAVIDGGGHGSSVIITGSNVVIRGLTIRNSGSDLNSLDSAVMTMGNRTEIADCTIEADGFGIYLRGASDCRILRNEIRGNRSLNSSKRGNGIHLWKTRNNLVVSNRIRDTRDGIYFSFADRNEIRGNMIERTRFAIHYMYSHHNRLLGNSFTGNAVGATLMFSQYSLVQGNQAHGNTRHGMLFKQVDNSVIKGNSVSGQNRGFFIQQAAMNRFENNLIATNDIGIYLSNGSEQNIFVGNTFLNNIDQIWQPPFEKEMGTKGPNSFYENGTGNFWSDYTGADAEGDGIGDTPYHETDVYGFLVDRYPEARVFALSPAVALLRKSEQLLPVVDLPGVTDLYPLMNPVLEFE